MIRTTPSIVRKKFFGVLQETEDNISAYVNSPGKDMTRRRSCTFRDTFLLTCSFQSERTNTEIFNFFSLNNRHIPSKSAFTQQRKKFNELLYPHIFHAFNSAVPFKKKHKGYHLIAVDGSDINLPTDKKDTVYAVKQARSDNYYYQMHLNALYDICENRYCGLVTQPRPNFNESKAFQQLLDEYNSSEPTIFIMDRGFINFNNIAHVTAKNQYYLIRAKAPGNSGSFLCHLAERDVEVDQNITIGVTRNRCRQYSKKPDKYKILRKYADFLPIEPGDTATVYQMNFRYICVKLSTGNYEYLITNLPKDEFSTEEIVKLYNMRWGIETSFRRLKYALSLSFLHSVKRDLIIQEVYAKMIVYNFASLLHQYAELDLMYKSKKGYKYNVSFDDTVPIAKRFLLKRIANHMIKAQLQRHLTQKHEHVHNPRNVNSQRVRPLGNRA